MSGQPRELAAFEADDDRRTLISGVVSKGLADHGYMVIDGVDGKDHYVVLNVPDELANYPVGSVMAAHHRVVTLYFASTLGCFPTFQRQSNQCFLTLSHVNI